MSVPAVSFEVFPPRTVDAAFNLWDTAQALAPLAPRFFSVTYGAGGSTRDITHDAAHVLRRTSGLPVAGHLTCVGAAPVTVPVAHVATDVHPTTRTVAVYAHLESAEEARLRHGQACRARLTLTETERPVVPPASLVERDGDRAELHRGDATPRAPPVEPAIS